MHSLVAKCKLFSLWTYLVNVCEVLWRQDLRNSVWIWIVNSRHLSFLGCGSSDSQTSSADHSSLPNIKSPAASKIPHIKKPLNAFMLFMKEMRQKVIDECTLKESAAINQILGRKVKCPFCWFEFSISCVDLWLLFLNLFLCNSINSHKCRSMLVHFLIIVTLVMIMMIITVIAREQFIMLQQVALPCLTAAESFWSLIISIRVITACKMIWS